MKPIRTHDALFRFVFGEPEQMAELLQAHLPAELVAAIDWSTLRRLDGSFVDEALRERRSDMLFEARMGQHRVLLYVVCEHKSRDERLAAWQVARYVVRIVDRWLAEHPEATSLPAVVPFVVYHGARPWRSPCSPDELVDFGDDAAAAALRLHQLRLPFVLLDLAAVAEEQIEAMRVSAVTSLTLGFLQFLRSCPPERAVAYVSRWRPIVARLLGHPRGKQVVLALFSWWLAQSSFDQKVAQTVMNKLHSPVDPDRDEDSPRPSNWDMLIEPRAEERAQELAPRLAEAMAQQLAERLAQDLAQDLAGKMAQDLAGKMAEDLARKMAEDLARKMAEDMAKNMAQDLAKGMAQDLAKGMAQDLAKNMAQDFVQHEATQAARAATQQLLQGLLVARFGELPPTVAQRLAAADQPTLAAWAMRFATATALADVFGT